MKAYTRSTTRCNELRPHASIGSGLTEGLKRMKKALLVMHAPLDATVNIDNASNIFFAARHPKSFVALDGADHMLSRREDATYAGSVLGAWAAR